MSKNIIELNGKRYDALTGKMLGATAQHPKPTASGRVIDGFMRPAAAVKAAEAPVFISVKRVAAPKKVAEPSEVTSVTVKRIAPAAKPVAVPVTVTAQTAQSVPSVHVTPSVHVVTVVKKSAEKPAASTPAAAEPVEVKPAARQAAPAAKAAHQTAAPATSGRSADSRHTDIKIIAAHQPQRAKTLMRSTVDKPKYTIKPAIKPQSPVEIAAVPNSKIATKRSVASIDPGRLERARRTLRNANVDRFGNRSEELAAGVVKTVHVAPIAVRQAPKAGHHAAAQAVHKPVDIFEEAIAQATSHMEPLHKIPKSRKRRILNISAFATAFLVIGGFFAFLNMPNIQLHVASIQAGFKASIPDYAPLGYALNGGVQRTGDTVSMVYRSGENKYTITQQPTSWDNETLIQNTLPLRSNYKTVSASGHTVYVYGNDAVWLSGHVRYDVVGNAPLTPTDISQLAMSM